MLRQKLTEHHGCVAAFMRSKPITTISHVSFWSSSLQYVTDMSQEVSSSPCGVENRKILFIPVVTEESQEFLGIPRLLSWISFIACLRLVPEPALQMHWSIQIPFDPERLLPQESPRRCSRVTPKPKPNFPTYTSN